MAKNVLTNSLSEPLNGSTSARVNIDVGDGNLIIDRQAAGEPALATGMLQYLEGQGLPTRTVVTGHDEISLTVRAGAAAKRWLRLPWSACNGATEWQIHLNPAVPCDITAHSNGGNMKLNLAGMRVSRLSADNGGGSVAVVLPDNAGDLSATARTGGGTVSVDMGSGATGSNAITAQSGGGSVVVRIPSGLPAKITATSGMGKVIVDPRFSKLEGNTYQSPGYDDSADRVEITASSGAGNVTVGVK